MRNTVKIGTSLTNLLKLFATNGIALDLLKGFSMKISFPHEIKPVNAELFVQIQKTLNEIVGTNRPFSEAIQQLEKGVEIGNKGQRFMTRSCAVRKLEVAPEFPPRSQKIRDDRHGPTSWVSITLTEGKFKQVRKMTAAVGFPTLRLIRVRVGDFTVFQLKNGEVMELKSLR